MKKDKDCNRNRQTTFFRPQVKKGPDKGLLKAEHNRSKLFSMQRTPAIAPDHAEINALQVVALLARFVRQ